MYVDSRKKNQVQFVWLTSTYMQVGIININYYYLNASSCLFVVFLYFQAIKYVNAQLYTLMLILTH